MGKKVAGFRRLLLRERFCWLKEPRGKDLQSSFVGWLHHVTVLQIILFHILDRGFHVLSFRIPLPILQNSGAVESLRDYNQRLVPP